MSVWLSTFSDALYALVLQTNEEWRRLLVNCMACCKSIISGVLVVYFFCEYRCRRSVHENRP